MNANPENVLAIARLKLVLGAAAVILTFIPALIVLGYTQWPIAVVLAIGNSALCLLWALRRKDELLLRVWAFALAFGIAELAVDAWLVFSTGTLTYAPYSSRGGWMIWASPAFMPVSWQVLVIHITCISEALRKHPLWLRLVVTTFTGGLYVPLAEEIAARAGFWSYVNTPKISEVPYYIIVGEAVLALSIVFLLPYLRKNRFSTGILCGTAAAGALFVGYAAGLSIFR